MNKKRAAQKRKSVIITVLIIILLTAVAFLQIFPFWLQFVTSLQPLDFIPEDGKIYWLPVSANFGNYLEAIEHVDLLRGALNSVIVAVGYTLLSALVILVVGYVLGKKDFAGKKVVKLFLLITMMAPGELMMVTNYKLVSELGWTNTFAGLILPGIVNVTGIFLVMSFMNSIPDAMLESAEIDGAGELKKLFKIVLPMCLPVLATYFILTFVAQWNDYLWPMIITSDPDLFTIQLKLTEFSEYYGGFADTVLRAAALIFTLIPVIIVYLCCQKQFVEGLSVTGMK
ncbi:MAG: carbohydrate ABC transporter permease [Clostridiales bacterium]|nr:carbohydrate ABC transporter permease [Clostridiales bacterium]